MKSSEQLNAARAAGLDRYQSTVPCSKGHTGDRYTKGRSCCTCAAENAILRGKRLSSEEVSSLRQKSKQLKRKGAAAKRLAAAPALSAERDRVKEVQARLGIDLPTSRKEALEVGSAFYFNARPCPKGHVTKRKTKSPGCEVCVAEVHRANLQRRRQEDAKALKERKRQSYERTKENHIATVRKYYNANRENISEKKKKYTRENYEIIRRGNILGRAVRHKATPLWLVGDLLEQVKAIYIEASGMKCAEGKTMEVDHVVPIKGKLVCGLHVPWNLRIISKRENCQKGSKFQDPYTAREVSIPLGCGAALGSYQLL